MKKLLLIAVMAGFSCLTSFNANAQFFTGLAFDVNWQNSGTVIKAGSETTINSTYGGEISPQIGYKFNEKLLAGARINFLFDKSYYTETDEITEIKTKYVTSSLGWDIAPFCRYRLVALGKNEWFSVWADAHLYYGVMYPKDIHESGYVTKEFIRKHLYGVQVMPALGFRISEKTTLFVNFAILSLAYSGSCTQYKDKKEYENKVILFTGKLNGLFSTIATDGLYGIKLGLVTTF